MIQCIVEKTKPIGLPECICIYYIDNGRTIYREWVCPDANGPIGENGKKWWIKRIKYVPKCNDEALELAKIFPEIEALPPKHLIWSSNRHNISIAKITYSHKLPSGRRNIDLKDSVFLKEQDSLDRDAFVREMKISIYSDKPLCPDWWNPFILTKLKESPQNSYNLLKEVLTLNRQKNDQSWSSACNRLELAYVLSESPKAEELLGIIRSVWQGDSFVFKKHRNLLIQKIESIIDFNWFKTAIRNAIGKDKKYNFYYRKKSRSFLFESSKYKGVFDVPFSLNNKEPIILMDDFLLDSVSKWEKKEKGSFFEFLIPVLRDCVNKVRDDLGVPRIGEGWISEMDLFHRICRLFPNDEVHHHWRPTWLGRQELDIAIPSKNIAFEYQGIQHYFPIEQFGGQEGFERIKERDEKKRLLCAKNGIKLIEIRFDQDFTDEDLIRMI